MHLLIVDDDQDSAQTLAQLLELMAAPVQIEVAYDGIQAVELVATGNLILDAVVTDIEMPRMDGLTAASKIRSALGLAAPVLIAMTDHAALCRRTAITDTFDHVLLKPVDLDALVGLLLTLRTRPLGAQH